MKRLLVVGLAVYLCLPLSLAAQSADKQTDQSKTVPPPSILDRRVKSQRNSNDNPFVISQYRPNYIIPYSYMKNTRSYDLTDNLDVSLDNAEATFQISIKMPIYLDEKEEDGLHFGFTARSFWQVYNSEISKPFRETNYEPEVFYTWYTDYHLLGYRFNRIQLGMNHQSNGQNQLRSRSWNRIFASAVFSDVDSLYYLKAWYRIPEDEKTDPLDPTGDDNPDITHFLGHFELGYGTKLGKGNLLTMVRNNLKTSDNKGSIEVLLSYPLTNRYQIMLHYFNGYGDSLIDYNRHQQRIGIGFQLSFL